MPSRAVMRKKARRQAKRLKQQQDKNTQDVKGTTPTGSNNININDNSIKQVYTSCKQNNGAFTMSNLSTLQHTCKQQQQLAPHFPFKVVNTNKVTIASPAHENVKASQYKRGRDERHEQYYNSNKQQVKRQKLTHKQRMKQAARAKLNKEIIRLNAITARASKQNAIINNSVVGTSTADNINFNGDDNDKNTHKSKMSDKVIETNLPDGDNIQVGGKRKIYAQAIHTQQVSKQSDLQSIASHQQSQQKLESDEWKQMSHTHSTMASQPIEQDYKQRHDPRFVNGTFWRNRKQKRGRTLFLGGIPSTYSVKQVEQLIDRVIRKDKNAFCYLKQLTQGENVVQHVDMLPLKHGNKIRHMFVVMKSVALAGCASLSLDGMRINQHALRCNFAADKTQRAEAIRRRSNTQLLTRR